MNHRRPKFRILWRSTTNRSRQILSPKLGVSSGHHTKLFQNHSLETYISPNPFPVLLFHIYVNLHLKCRYFNPWRLPSGSWWDPDDDDSRASILSLNFVHIIYYTEHGFCYPTPIHAITPSRHWFNPSALQSTVPSTRTEHLVVVGNFDCVTVSLTTPFENGFVVHKCQHSQQTQTQPSFTKVATGEERDSFAHFLNRPLE